MAEIIPSNSNTTTTPPQQPPQFTIPWPTPIRDYRRSPTPSMPHTVTSLKLGVRTYSICIASFPIGTSFLSDLMKCTGIGDGPLKLITGKKVVSVGCCHLQP
ncbi:uncharacterized protein LOC141592870 [Silene latifolia]|uniref:uncharacterized protein LOC141592870 n=1 Tax=Silene latifolia TaxID=37657 RepID=UPI003D785879